MICKGCGETYDEERFPVCPFCLTANKEIENVISEADNVDEWDIGNRENIVSSEAVRLPDNNSNMMDDIEIENVSNSFTEDLETEIDIDIVDIHSLSMRAKNTLRRNGIFKLSDLRHFLEDKELKDIRGLGKLCEEEVKYVLAHNHYAEEDYETDFEKGKTKEKISEFYSENRFNLFVKYCEENSLIYMDDLQEFDFNILNDVSGIGKGKISDIISMYKEFNSGVAYASDKVSGITTKVSKEKLFVYINIQLIDLDIMLLTGFGIKPRTVSLLENRGYKKVGDIQNISVKALKQIVGDRNIEKFMAVEDDLKKSLIEIFGDFLNTISKEEDFELDLKRADGITLQDLGDNYGVTRERVRQRISKFNSRLDPFMMPIIDHFMYPKNYVSAQELLDIYDNDDFDRILIYWCKCSKNLEYISFADVFVYANQGKDSTENIILNIAEEFIGDGLNLYDNLEVLESLMQENGYPYIDGGAFLNLVQQHGYQVYGDYIVKGKQSYGYLCARIVAEKFPEGIKLYDEKDLNLLRQYAISEYGDIGMPDSDRAVSTRLSDYLVLSGRGTVTAESNIHIEMSILDEIKEYIDQSLEGEIHYSELFSTFEGKLRMMSNIDNYNFLHGVLKLYYSEDYDFSNRDYLKKRGKGYASGKISTRLKDYIVSIGMPVHRNDIKKKILGLTDISIVNAVASEPELFQWDYNYYYCISLMKISSEDRLYLQQQIENIMLQNDGYCSDNMLLDEVKRFRAEFLVRNNIETSNNLYYLCQKLFSDVFDFRRPHIGRKGLLEDISVRNVALHLLGYPDKLSFKSYQMIAEKLRWSPVTSGMVFADIEQDFVRVTDDLYVKKEYFELEQGIVDKVEQTLRSNMKYGYLSLINYDSWDDLPDVGFEWNVYFLRSLIDKFIPNLKIVETRAKDRRYERGIVIDATSDITDYTELVIRFLNTCGYSELSENNMLTLLVLNNLTYKMIPKELYSSDKLIYGDECFRIVPQKTIN